MKHENKVVGPELINEIDQEITDFEKDLGEEISEMQGILDEIEKEMEYHKKFVEGTCIPGDNDKDQYGMLGQLFFKARDCYETINKIAEENGIPFADDDNKENI